MKKDDPSKDQSSIQDHDFLDFDIDSYLEELDDKYQIKHPERKTKNEPEEDHQSTDDTDSKDNINNTDDKQEQQSSDPHPDNDDESESVAAEPKSENQAQETNDEDIVLPLSRTERNKHLPKEKSEYTKNIIAFVKSPKLWKWLGTIVLIIALFFTAYGGYLFYKTNHLLDSSYTERPSSKSKNEKITMTNKPISILLIGLDNNKERNLDTTRTDSLIACTFNPKTGETSMVSIPRDTYVEMYDKENGYNTTGKINSAYSLNGVNSTISAVEKLLNIPIDYYVQVDFNALEDVVNAFGGIYVDVPFTLTEQDAHGKKRIHLKEGDHQKLNGEQALAFARTRHIDNDIQRGVRQQEVISGIVEQALKVGSMTKYVKVLNSLEGHIQTDIPKSILLGLAKSSTEHKIKIEHYQFKWASYNYNGESFVALNKESLSYVSHKLRVQLGEDDKDERDQDGYQEPETTELDPSTYPSYGVTWD